MPLDPRLILGAVSPPGASKPFDPITTMGNIAQTQGLVQQQQIGQLQLADAQRAEQERGTLARAFQDPRARVTDPATGVTTVDVPKALGLALTTSRNPLGIVKAQTEYGKSQAESRKAQLDAAKAQLDTTAAQLDISGRIANGIEQSIAAGTNPNAAWTAGLEEMRRNGIPTPSAPPTYDRGFLEQWKGKALTQKDAIAAQQNAVAQKLREQEVEETKKRTTIEAKQLGLRERETVVKEREEERLGRKPVIEPSAAVQDALLARYGPKASWSDYSTDEYAAARKDAGEEKVAVSGAQGAVGAQARTASETAQKRLEALDKGGLTAQDTHTTLDEVDRLIKEGVYGNSPLDRAAMAAYRTGMNPNDTTAQRTNRLRELGSQLVLARGSLGSNVSNTDAQIYAKAAGNFEQAKNPQEMLESIKSMRTILNKAIDYANRSREEYERTGKLPPLEGRPQPASSSGAAPPGAAPQRITRSQIEAKLKPGWTLDQAVEWYKSQGFQVD